MIAHNNYMIECIYCGFLAEEYTPAKRGTVPQVGDVYICYECGGVALYADDSSGGLKAQVPPPDVAKQLRNSKNFQKLLGRIRAEIKERKQ